MSWMQRKIEQSGLFTVKPLKWKRDRKTKQDVYANTVLGDIHVFLDTESGPKDFWCASPAMEAENHEENAIHYRNFKTKEAAIDAAEKWFWKKIIPAFKQYKGDEQ